METKPQKHSVFIVGGFVLMAASFYTGLSQNWVGFGIAIAGLITISVAFIINIAHLDIDKRIDELKTLIVESKAKKPKDEQKQ